MYSRILVPVDLAHAPEMGKSLSVAAALSTQFSAALTCVGVTGNAPSDVAPTPEAYAQRLEDFAARESDARGLPITAKSYVVHDPGAELDATLLQAIKDLDVDLVVMSSHAPRFADLLMGSHGGSLAARAEASVFIVR